MGGKGTSDVLGGEGLHSLAMTGEYLLAAIQIAILLVYRTNMDTRAVERARDIAYPKYIDCPRCIDWHLPIVHGINKHCKLFVVKFVQGISRCGQPVTACGLLVAYGKRNDEGGS